MANGSFTPKLVEPGWFRRWTQDGLDLIRRQPLAFFISFLCMLGIALMPQSIFYVAISILEMSWIFSLLRSADCTQSVFHIFYNCLKSIALVMRDLSLVFLLVGIVISVLFSFSSSVVSIMHGGAHLLHPNDRWLHQATWVKTLFDGTQLDQSGTATPIVPIMVFVCMSIGYSGFMHVIAYAVKVSYSNYAPTITFLLLGAAPGFMTAPAHGLATPWVTVVLACLMAVINFILIIAAYFYGRETIDGNKENSKALSGVTAGKRNRIFAGA